MKFYRPSTRLVTACCVLSSLCVFGTAKRAWGTERHVPAEYATIQEAVDASVAGDVVMLADGTYTGPGNCDVDVYDLQLTIKSVSNDPSLCTIDCQGGAENEHRGFRFGGTWASGSLLQGVTVTNGYLSGAGGGAVLVTTAANITIDNCVLTNNVAKWAGALNVHQAAATVSNSQIIGNAVPAMFGNGSGGGISALSSAVELVNCTVEFNSAPSSGGGLATSGSMRAPAPLTITGCTFRYNTSASTGGAVDAWSFAPTTITDSVLSHNTSASNGGALNIVGSSPAWIEDCELCGNVADEYGGALRFGNGESLDVIGCEIRGNSAGHGGGAFRISYSYFHNLFQSCVISDNSATYEGGVLRSYYTTATFANCTLINNSASEGGALDLNDASHVTVLNCIATGNTAADGSLAYVYGTVNNPSDLTVSYCDVVGGADTVALEWEATLDWAASNIDADPLLVDADGADNDPATWEDNDYHLSADSPCISMGDPAADYTDQTDIDGEPRVMLELVDMGADEVTAFDDCNGNWIPDAVDIATGSSADENGNGIPDECEPATENLLVDFEFDEDVLLFMPNAPGYWSGEPAASVAAEQGIAPYSGDHMLRFIYAVCATPSDSTVCQVQQAVELAPTGLQGQLLRLGCSAYFNRVSIDEETDTAFGIRLFACAGDVSAWPGGGYLMYAIDTFASDGELATWERFELHTVIPADTDFVVVEVRALENVFNDIEGTEFDGHYADYAELWIDGVIGDLDCDLGVDFDDISPFVLALGGQAGYEAVYPDCDWLNADCNSDGDVDFDDISAFVAILSS